MLDFRRSKATLDRGAAAMAAELRGGSEGMARGLHIDWGKALIPLSLLAMFMMWELGTPLWVLGLFTLWMPAYYLAYPMYLRRKWTAFEKSFATKFQQGDYRALLDAYKGEWFLRKFGPKAEMLQKLALIYAAMDKNREAEQVLERALELTPAPYRDRLYFNLANIKYELGKYAEAEQMYKALRQGSPYRHAVQTQLALIDLHQGRNVERAREFLESERDGAHGPARQRIDDALSATGA